MAELKPCPFCGGTEIEFEQAVFTGVFIIPPRIGCRRCNYKIDGGLYGVGLDNCTKAILSNDLLVNWWNRRANLNGPDGRDGRRGKTKNGEKND